jgi:hypothetical protein
LVAIGLRALRHAILLFFTRPPSSFEPRVRDFRQTIE